MKLHLGCGKRFIPGFVHVDLDDFPHIDHRHAIDSLPMFGDGSAELIYCCHAFQYFDWVRGAEVLTEWRRVLRPGGTLRLAVPDFEALVGLYGETGELAKVIGPLFGRMPISAPTGTRTIYHHTTYDLKTLTRICEGAGFSNVRRFDWRATEHAGVDDFSQAYHPHMDKANGRLISLNVEATKPAG